MTRRIAIAAAGLVAMLILAGCTGGDGTAVLDVGTPTPKAVSDEGTGWIEGYVLDSSQLPLANATVVLEESGLQANRVAKTTTGPDGFFEFLSLAQGVYRVQAKLAGFGQAALLVTVKIDEASEVQLTLEEVAGEVPYLSVLSRTGIFYCAYGVVLRPGNCDFLVQATNPGSESAYFGNFTIEPGHKATVVETTWASDEHVLDVWTSYVDEDTGDWIYFLEVVGPPVLRLELRPGQEFQGSYDSATTDDFYGEVPDSSQGFLMHTETSYLGQFQQEADAYLNPVCQNTWGYCAGVGAVLDFRFDQYVSTFYHAAPIDVSSYSAVPAK